MRSLNDSLKYYSSEMESQYQSNQVLEKKIEEMKLSLEVYYLFNNIYICSN